MPLDANCVLCESVRAEVTGKFTFVGAICGDIIASGREFKENFSLFCSILDIPEGKHQFHLKLTMPGGKSETQQFEVTVPSNANNATVHIGDVPVVAHEDGFFEIRARLGDQRKYTMLHRFHISLDNAEIESAEAS